MANPQREDGYTALANEIMEAMARTRLSPTQYRLLFVVWRYTYGFQRKEADLSLTFLANATGCDKRQIQRELKDLGQRRIINQDTTGQSRTIRFNKNYDLWLDDIPSPKKGIGETTNGDMTDGETTNGENVNSAIGEMTNPPIGEITNQERKSLNKSFKENIYSVFEFWNEQKIIVHRELTEKLKGHISAKLNNYTLDEIKAAIKNYSTVLKGDDYFFSYKWTLGEFFTRENGFVKFLPESDPLTNYLRDKGVKPNDKGPPANRRDPPRNPNVNWDKFYQ